MEEEREGSTERIVIPLVHVGLPVRVRMNKKNAQPRGIRQIRLVLCLSGVHEVILLALGVLLALGKAAGVVVCTLADRTYIFNENTGPQLVGNRGYSR